MFKMLLMWEQVETISHLFLHCKWTEQLWRMFISLRKINWVKPGNIRGVLNSWNSDGNATTKGEMEDCPSMHMVDCMEREKS